MQSVTTQVACFLSSGEEFLLKESYSQALDLFERALALAQRNQDSQSEALALQRLGTVHLMQDQPELAIAAVAQALDIASEQGNPYILYDCHRQLAQIHKVLRHFEQSLQHFEMAESIRVDILNHQPHPAIEHAYPEITAAAAAPSADSPHGVQAALPGIEAIQSSSTTVFLFRTIIERANVEVGIFPDGYIDNHHRPAILAFVQEITQPKQVKSKLHRSAKQFRTRFNHIPIGLYRFDSGGSPIEINPAMAHMLGFATREAFLQDYALNAARNRQQWQGYLLRAEQAGGCELQIPRQEGREIWVKMCAKAVTDTEDGQKFCEGSLEDISEIKAAYFALEELAIRDPLTRVYNRRHFLQLANREMARANRFGHPASVIMLDIDYFKAINDRHGHWIGDRVLQAVAANLQNNLRQSDVLARYGGEKFVILMPETAQSQAWNGAERLRRVIAESSGHGKTSELGLTASLGITSWVPTSAGIFPNIDELIQQADHALHQAKRAGRNQTLAYSPYFPNWPDNHAWPTSDDAGVSRPAAQAGEPVPD